MPAYVDYNSAKPDVTTSPATFGGDDVNNQKALRDMVIAGRVPGFIFSRTTGTGPSAAQPQIYQWTNGAIAFRMNATYALVSGAYQMATVQWEWSNDIGTGNTWTLMGAQSAVTSDASDNITGTTVNGGFIFMVLELVQKITRTIATVTAHIAATGTAVHGLGTAALANLANMVIGGTSSFDGTGGVGKAPPSRSMRAACARPSPTSARSARAARPPLIATPRALRLHAEQHHQRLDDHRDVRRSGGWQDANHHVRDHQRPARHRWAHHLPHVLQVGRRQRHAAGRHGARAVGAQPLLRHHQGRRHGLGRHAPREARMSLLDRLKARKAARGARHSPRRRSLVPAALPASTIAQAMGPTPQVEARRAPARPARAHGRGHVHRSSPTSWAVSSWASA
jgi:hypothetical protein